MPGPFLPTVAAALSGNGCGGACTRQIPVGVLAVIGQLHRNGAAGELNGRGQGVAGGHLGEVHRNLRGQHLCVAHGAVGGRGQEVRGADIQHAGPGVALDDRLVELRRVGHAVEGAHCRVIGLGAALALGQRGHLGVVVGVPQQRRGDVFGGGESELEGHLQVRRAVQVGAALELALGIDGGGNPQAGTAVQARTDATAGGEGAAACALRARGGCGHVGHLHGVGVQTVAGVEIVGGVGVEGLGEDTELQGRGLRHVGGGRVGGYGCGGCDDRRAPESTLDEGAAVYAALAGSGGAVTGLLLRHVIILSSTGEYGDARDTNY